MVAVASAGRAYAPPDRIGHQISPFAAKSAAVTAAPVGTYAALLQPFAPAQQTIITAWYASHAMESMNFRSDAQWRWMSAHDYPTADDVLRASAMTEAQLRNLAIHGDTKANFFYLAHLLDKLAQADGVATVPSQYKAELRAEAVASMDRALGSGSAFAGFMFGNYYARLHGYKMKALGDLCGLAWAGAAGDTRTPNLSSAQARLAGVSGMQAAELSFDMFRAATRSNPHFLNARHAYGEPIMPVPGG